MLAVRPSNAHPLFELQSLLNGHRVGLGNDRDDVDRVAQALHEFNVQLTEPARDGWKKRAGGWGGVGGAHAVSLSAVHVET